MLSCKFCGGRQAAEVVPGERELQRGFTLHGRKGLRSGFCSHMQRNTVNPPTHPVALTNCLYLSFPSVPTINCPFCGGINSLPRMSITCPPNVVNTGGEKTQKRRNRKSVPDYVATMNVKQFTKPNGSPRFDVLQRPQLVSVLPEQFKLQATESFQFMNQLEV